MTHPSFPPGAQASAGQHVDAEYCTGDDPIVSKDNNVGLIDEAIMKAQQQAGADYLTDVTIWSDGNCIAVEGTAMKFNASSGTSEPTASKGVPDAS